MLGVNPIVKGSVASSVESHFNVPLLYAYTVGLSVI